MILLLGGTSETAPLATALHAAGHAVLVSLATEVALKLPVGEGIELRRGRLNRKELVELIAARGIRALVDAAHPYAVAAHETAAAAAAEAAIPYLHWLRAASELDEATGLYCVTDHAAAARQAVVLGRPILLTVGSRNVAPYVVAARAAGLGIAARVLPEPDSLAACRQAGLEEKEIIGVRGPFTVGQTEALLRAGDFGTLVTKESGAAGGVPEKLEAAARAGAAVVVVARAQFDERTLCRSVEELIARLETELAG